MYIYNICTYICSLCGHWNILCFSALFFRDILNTVAWNEFALIKYECNSYISPVRVSAWAKIKQTCERKKKKKRKGNHRHLSTQLFLFIFFTKLTSVFIMLWLCIWGGWYRIMNPTKWGAEARGKKERKTLRNHSPRWVKQYVTSIRHHGKKYCRKLQTPVSSWTLWGQHFLISLQWETSRWSSWQRLIGDINWRSVWFLLGLTELGDSCSTQSGVKLTLMVLIDFCITTAKQALTHLLCSVYTKHTTLEIKCCLSLSQTKRRPGDSGTIVAKRPYKKKVWKQQNLK